MPETTLRPGDRVYGFVVRRVNDATDVRARAIELEHEKTGARLLHLLADDPENLFAVAFRTPPADNTGLPHILEHTVLCGSEKYPVKDPFVELLKTSLATFLNAMTWPDKTVYPCASMNEKDFFHLASVYADAVFRPRITPDHFKQEGHHLELEDPGDPASALVINGIVYNEMKGAYSSLDGVIEREETRRLCPDNAYGLDSGGDPEAIPTLTYEAFREFHRRYYHPSNSYIFLYGNIDTRKHLEFLDREYLSTYDRLDIDTSIAPQPRWDTPRSAEIPYPAAPDDFPAGHTAVTLSWLTGDATDSVTGLALNVLEHYLLGNAASPLRKALIDSKLGEELTGSGYADFQRDTFFTVGLKGTAPEKAAEVAGLIRRVLREEAENGLDREKITAAFQMLEMSAREIKTQYPLRLMERAYKAWIYDADPVAALQLASQLDEVRRRFENEPRFLEEILKRAVVGNPHELMLVFVPDADYNRRLTQKEADALAQRKTTLSADDLVCIAREAKELAAMQDAPNTPEALATLPRLSLHDVNPLPLDPEVSETVCGEVPVVRSHTFSGGIAYATLAFDLRDLTPQQLALLPVYADALCGMGAGGLDYAAFAEKEAACCGGVHASPDAFGRNDDALVMQPLLVATVRGLERQLPQMLEVFRQRLFEPDFSDAGRLRDLMLQARVNLHAALIQSGNQFASLYAARTLSPNAWLKEQFGGFTAVRLFDHLADQFNADELIPRLEELRGLLANRARLTFAVGGSDAALTQMEEWIAGVSGKLAAQAVAPRVWEKPAPVAGPEGIAAPADVAFVARALPSVCPAHPLAPALNLLGVNLSYGYLWNEVRVRRGAYGCRAGHQPGVGVFGYSSYRDPNIASTLAVYDGVADYVLNEMDLSPEAVEQAVIGAIKTLDVPWRPASALSAALSRKLSGSTPESRKTYRSRLLGLTGDQVRQAVRELLQPGVGSAPVCVLSSRQRLESAASEGVPLTISDL